MSKKKIAIIVAIILVLLAICCGGSVALWSYTKNNLNVNPDNGTTVTATPTTSVTQTTTPSVTGTTRPSATTSPTGSTTPTNTSGVSTDFKNNVSYKYYTITGSTEDELRAQMNQKGSLDPNENKRYDALTTWNTSWRYQPKTGNGTCSVQSITVTTEVIISMPKWEKPANVSPALSQKWDAYIKNLTTHENGHKDLSLTYGKKIADSYKNGKSAADCNKLQSDVNAANNAILKENNQADIDYDARTQHGATEGAVFP